MKDSPSPRTAELWGIERWIRVISHLRVRSPRIGSSFLPLSSTYHGRGGTVAIVVQKYGGSSVADVGKVRAVAERVMRTVNAGHNVVVVVSAMGDTTDDL